MQVSNDKPAILTQLAPGVSHLWLQTAQAVDPLNNQLPDELLQSFSEQIVSYFGTLSPSSRVIIVQHPGWLPLLKRLKQDLPSTVIYDCMDRICEFPGAPTWLAGYERELIALSDHLIVSSEELQKYVGRPATIIRNGSNPERFTLSMRPWSQTQKPVIGYYGSLSSWIDFEGIFEVASDHPDWNFLLVGPQTDNPPQSALPNVEIRDAVPYDQIPALLESFDVAIVPFRQNELTSAVNPVKVYEYLAAGKPVAAVEIPELTILADVLYLARTASALGNAIERSLCEAKEPVNVIREQRRAVATANSWSSRVAQFEEILCKVQSYDAGSVAHENRIYEQFARESEQSWQFRYNDQIRFWKEELERRESSWREELERREVSWREELGRLEASWREELERHDTAWREEVRRHQEIIKELRGEI